MYKWSGRQWPSSRRMRTLLPVLLALLLTFAALVSAVAGYEQAVIRLYPALVFVALALGAISIKTALRRP